jgi:hypothetical protein
MTTVFTIAAIAFASLAMPAEGQGSRQTGVAPVLASQQKPSLHAQPSQGAIKPGTGMEQDRVRKGLGSTDDARPIHQ